MKLLTKVVRLYQTKSFTVRERKGFGEKKRLSSFLVKLLVEITVSVFTFLK